MTRLIPRFLALIIVLACSDSTGPSDVQVRIANLSQFAFESVDVVFPRDSVDYGTVAAHSTTAYQGVEVAYRYALIIVHVSGQEMRLQPIDYVGESELRPGRYTYALNVDVEGRLTLAFQSDD